MAYQIPSFQLGVIQANADLSAYQFKFVDVAPATGSGLSGAALIPPAATGDAVVGVLQNKPQLGEAGTCMVAGVTKVVLGENVTVGALLMAHTDGSAKIATSGKFIRAKALEAGSTGEVIAALLFTMGKV